MSAFALVDANNFYATCEKIFQPQLRHKPVVVLSNNDGCVVARSAESKALGIPMGAPIHEWKDFCREHGVVVKSSNYVLYGDMSARMLRILQRHSPDVESYSIDESFIGLDGFDNLTDRGRAMRQDVQRLIHVTCGVGIGPSKTLAKFANHIAKKHPEYGGVFNTFDHAQLLLDELMGHYPVTEVWGVGPRLGRKLSDLGINTVLDLRHATPRDIRQEFGVVLERTVRELNGMSCLPLEMVAPDKQQIISSRSFGQLIYGLNDLSAAVSAFVARAAEKLRKQKSTCSIINVGIRTNPFRVNDPQYSKSIGLPLSTPTADTRRLTELALFLLRRIYRPGYAYKKASITLMGIAPESVVQGSLFDEMGSLPAIHLMETMDKINKQFGRGTLKLASESLGHAWQMKQKDRSQRFTTNWNELPSASTSR